MLVGLYALLVAALGSTGAADTLKVASEPGSGPDSLPFRLRPIAAVATTGSGLLVAPAGVAADAFGRIYVTDAALHRLQRYDDRGRWLGEAGILGSGEGQMRRPGAVATHGTLGVVVLDRENRRVLLYDLFGRLEGTLIDLEASPLRDRLGRVDPVDLAADRGGTVYLADGERDRLLVFDSSGGFVRELGGFGARPGSFRGLSGVAVDRQGNLVTAERVNARIQRLDPGGRVIAAWPLPVLPTPAALAVAADDSGRVAAADEATGKLWVFVGSGEKMASLAALEAPRALAFARDGTLLVAESGAGRVRRFALEPVPEEPDSQPE